MIYSNLSIGELLISEDYINIPTPLAIAVGLPKAAILKSVHAWCGSNRVHGKQEYFKAGYWWTKGTYELWQKQMPYIGCVGTVKRLILSLEKDEIIVSDFLHAKRSDREKWYRVDLEALEKFCNAKLVEFAKTMRTKCDDDENTANDSVTKSDDHRHKIGRSISTKCDDDLYLNKLSNQPDLNNLVREEEAHSQKALPELEEKSTQDPIESQSASLSIEQKDSADDETISGETVSSAAPIFQPQKNNATASYEKRFVSPQKYPALIEAGHGDIMIGTGYLDFDPIVVEVAVLHLKKHELACEVGDGKRFISNRIKQADWGAIELLKESAAAIALNRKKTEAAIAASTNTNGEYYDTSRYCVAEPPVIDLEARAKATEVGRAKVREILAEAKKKRAS